jgi:hypothetical protein
MKMYPWLWIWNPQFHFPWSGSVAQRIEPITLFDSIKADAGDGAIEKKAFDVASYGRQLGLITEVLIGLAEKQQALPPEAAASLERLKGIRDRIKIIKDEESASLAQDIEARVDRLRRSNPAEYAKLRVKLQPMLTLDRT